MKNLKLITLLLSLLFIQESTAQLTIGIKGGYSRAWQNYGDVIVPEGARIHIDGFHGNLQGYFALNNYLQIGIEPGLARRGAACIPGWNGGINPNPVFPGDSKFLLNYIELPLMIRGALPLITDRFNIFAKAGYGGAIIASGIRENEMTGERSKLLVRDVLSDLNTWDHGIYSSIGFTVNLKRSQIFMSSDYYFGLIDAERFSTSKNRALNFNLGYTYTFPKKDQ